MRESAVRYLIERNGVVMQLVRSGNTIYDTETGVANNNIISWPVVGLFVSDSFRRRDGALVSQGDVRILLAAADMEDAPRVSDQLFYDGAVYRMTRIDVVRERSEAVAYLCNLAEK
jgi:hypothetical protein